ncbi:hypothetical protein AGMMS49982_03400 [Bacteroidia bacterium]|nr:hypothetical protein AGMMS49982_03400 [Bacteroidia bacterium]
MKIYLDSSALVKSISNEKGSAEFRSVLDGWLQEGCGLPYLRSMDALHVATAELIQPQFAVTFDDKQTIAFNDVGIETWSEK